MEEYYSALVPHTKWWQQESRLREPMQYLLACLEAHRIRGIFYILGDVANCYPSLVKTIVEAGHLLGSHGYYHQHGEQEGDASDRLARETIAQVPSCRWTTRYRSPYWDSTPRPGAAGGAFFRLLPYPLFHVELLRSRQFWLHPHDLDPGQPRLPGAPWWRYVGLETAREKLQRVLSEHTWRNPDDTR